MKARINEVACKAFLESSNIEEAKLIRFEKGKIRSISQPMLGFSICWLKSVTLKGKRITVLVDHD